MSENKTVDQRIDILFEQFDKNKFLIPFGIACHIPDTSSFEADILIKVLQNIYKDHICLYAPSTSFPNGKYFELKLNEEKRKIIQLQTDIVSKNKYLEEIVAIEKKVKAEIQDLEKKLFEISKQ